MPMVCATPRQEGETWREQNKEILVKTGPRGACSFGVSAMDCILRDGTGKEERCVIYGCATDHQS